jgi:hypothetical protein
MSSEIESNHRLEKAVQIARCPRMPLLLSLIGRPNATSNLELL